MRQAFDDAVEVVRIARIEAARRERLNNVLAQLRDGVISVDMGERVDTDQLRRFGARTFLTSCMPLTEQGVQTGAVLTCQDAAAIERAGRTLRERRDRSAVVARYQLSDLVAESAPIQHRLNILRVQLSCRCAS